MTEFHKDDVLSIEFESSKGHGIKLVVHALNEEGKEVVTHTIRILPDLSGSIVSPRKRQVYVGVDMHTIYPDGAETPDRDWEKE